jgi:hypothetical protein
VGSATRRRCRGDAATLRASDIGRRNLETVDNSPRYLLWRSLCSVEQEFDDTPRVDAPTSASARLQMPTPWRRDGHVHLGAQRQPDVARRHAVGERLTAVR